MKKVLIVDDSLVIRRYIRLILEVGGYEVSGEAENGIEAVEKYLKLKPDVVTMDIDMPLMDGIQALKKIKEVDENAKVIIITDTDKDSFQDDIFESVACGFIRKPFEAEKILAFLHKIFGDKN